MSAERKKILEMLEAGKINANEAEKLLNAIGQGEEGEVADMIKNQEPKYMIVNVLSAGQDGKEVEKVNVRVPFQVLRAGVKLASLIPGNVKTKVNHALEEQGINFDFDNIKPENIEELIQALGDMTVEVNDDNDKVRVYCV